jgi:hypothetical protein
MHTQSYYSKTSLSQASTTSSRSSQHSQKKFSLSKITSSIFRSKCPASIDIPKSRQVSQREILRSDPETSYFPQGYTANNPTEMSPTISSPQSPRSDCDIKHVPTPTRKNSGDYKRYSGTVNHYGRHSNDWLFGGFSVRETVRDGLGKLRNSDKES